VEATQLLSATKESSGERAAAIGTHQRVHHTFNIHQKKPFGIFGERLFLSLCLPLAASRKPLSLLNAQVATASPPVQSYFKIRDTLPTAGTNRSRKVEENIARKN
jgi:hypothetical protein